MVQRHFSLFWRNCPFFLHTSPLSEPPIIYCHVFWVYFKFYRLIYLFNYFFELFNFGLNMFLVPINIPSELLIKILKVWTPNSGSWQRHCLESKVKDYQTNIIKNTNIYKRGWVPQKKKNSLVSIGRGLSNSYAFTCGNIGK